MKWRILNIVIIILLLTNLLKSQDEHQKFSLDGVYLGFNTLIAVNNLEIYGKINYLSLEQISLNIEPGAEIIVGIVGAERGIYSGSPFLNLNLINSIVLFPNYGISIKLFGGLCHSNMGMFLEGGEISTTTYFRYGSGIELNISKEFKLIGKLMNVKKMRLDDIPVYLGFGFLIKLF